MYVHRSVDKIPTTNQWSEKNHVVYTGVAGTGPGFYVGAIFITVTQFYLCRHDSKMCSCIGKYASCYGISAALYKFRHVVGHKIESLKKAYIKELLCECQEGDTESITELPELKHGRPVLFEIEIYSQVQLYLQKVRQQRRGGII